MGHADPVLRHWRSLLRHRARELETPNPQVETVGIAVGTPGPVLKRCYPKFGTRNPRVGTLQKRLGHPKSPPGCPKPRSRCLRIVPQCLNPRISCLSSRARCLSSPPERLNPRVRCPNRRFRCLNPWVRAFQLRAQRLNSRAGRSLARRRPLASDAAEGNRRPPTTPFQVRRPRWRNATTAAAPFSPAAPAPGICASATSVDSRRVPSCDSRIPSRSTAPRRCWVIRNFVGIASRLIADPPWTTDPRQAFSAGYMLTPAGQR